MNKLQANLSLLAITFLAGIQYAFLKNVPDTVSNFAFLFVTNFLGLIICLLALGGELYRATKKQVARSAVLALFLLGFNVFMLLGSRGLDTTTTSFIVTAYIVFVPVVAVLFKGKVTRMQIVGVAVVLIGLALSLEVNPQNLGNVHVLYLLAADLFFAAFIVLTERLAPQMNPAVLIFGELLFGSIFSLIGWLIQDGGDFSLPRDPGFWSSAFFIAFFIRGMYGIVQIYAQRYVGAIQVSLIFSTEIIFTLLMAPVLSRLLGGEAETIDLYKILGCLIIVGGVLIADGTVLRFFGLGQGRKRGELARQFFYRLRFVLLLTAGYCAVSLPFILTDFLGAGSVTSPGACFAFLSGLLFGAPAWIACAVGQTVNNLAAGQWGMEGLAALLCVGWSALCPRLIWYYRKDARQAALRTREEFLKLSAAALAAGAGSAGLYALLVGKNSLALLSGSFTLFWCLVIGAPLFILLTSIFGIQEILRPELRLPFDLDLDIPPTAEAIGQVNDQVEELSEAKGMERKTAFRLMSCLEEILLRILEQGDAPQNIKIQARVGETVMITLRYRGIRYNPLRMGKGESLEDLLGLNMVMQMSLRASYARRGEENEIKIIL